MASGSRCFPLRLGGGDVSEFIERLQRIYLRANARSQGAAGAGERPFTGLVTVGHSFCGQVLWQSLQRLMEDPLVRRAPCMANLLDPRRICTDDQYRAARDELDELIGSDLDAPGGNRVDELIELIENYEVSMRFVPDWSDQFANAA